jgi:hypothetical protein
MAAVTNQLSGYGITVSLPLGWNGIIYQRDPIVKDEVRRPILHGSTVDVTLDQGDFGDGLVENLASDDVFVDLVEIDPDNELALANPGFVRRLGGDAFAGNKLRRLILGQGGYEGFFTESGRAFCMYVVIGSIANLDALLDPINILLGSVEIDQGQHFAIGT